MHLALQLCSSLAEAASTLNFCWDIRDPCDLPEMPSPPIACWTRPKAAVHVGDMAPADRVALAKSPLPEPVNALHCSATALLHYHPCRVLSVFWSLLGAWAMKIARVRMLCVRAGLLANAHSSVQGFRDRQGTTWSA
jgi:hypothetical protein